MLMDCSGGKDLVRNSTLLSYVEEVEPSPPRPLQRSPRPLSTSQYRQRQNSHDDEEGEDEDGDGSDNDDGHHELRATTSSLSEVDCSIFMMVDNEAEMDECPLCVDPMGLADVHFPLHCPESNCDFNMCAACILGMLKSEADEYEEASDGSRQVKFRISCPSCRSKYIAPDPDMDLAAQQEEKKEAALPRNKAIATLHKGRHPQQPIVGYVLLLREAYEQTNLLKTNDSELSSTDLQKKHAFIQETSVDDLKEAMLNYEIYLSQIRKKAHIFRFDWNDFKVLARTAGGSALELRNAKLHNKPWRDPTLFMGLEELMSLEEQEFVTQLMCSNDTNNLAQAAHIMHGVLGALGTSRPSAVVVQELSGFGATLSPLPHSPHKVKPPPPLDPKIAQKIKGRFPLPAHMPCCFILPVYNPYDIRNLPLKFETNLQKFKSDLQLAQVRGIGGRSGLRRGDIITHIHVDPVSSHAQYVEVLANMYEENPKEELMIVVNATEETAKALRERAQAMQQAKIYSS